MVERNYTLFDNFEYKGMWWLPENPERKVAGILSVQNRDIKLDLFDSLKRSNLRDYLSSGNEVFSPKIIQGITDNGKPCTLLNTFLANRNDNSSGVCNESYVVNFLLVGKLYNLTDEIKFSSVSINYTYLEEWLGYQPFKINYNEKPLTAKFEPPVFFEFDIDSIDSKITLSGDLITSIEHFTSFEWNYRAFIKVTPKDYMDYNWYLEIISSIGNLLTLLTGEPIYPKQIKACGSDIEIGAGQKTKEIIEFFYGLWGDKLPKTIHCNEMIAPLPILKERLNIIFQKWFEKSLLLKPTCDLFFSTFRTKTYQDAVFLNLVQAIESYHRRKCSGIYVDKEEYAKYEKLMTEAIPHEMPKDLKESFRRRLRYGNEYALRKRIREIFSNVQKSMLELIANNTEKFIEKIVDTRNYLTHYDKELESRSITKGIDFYYANEKLWLLLIVLLLKELDIEDSIVADRIKNIRRFSDLQKRKDNFLE
ncbi:MAG: HEPN domain-containing protein [Sedimentisphaerales bacterium]